LPLHLAGIGHCLMSLLGHCVDLFCDSISLNLEHFSHGLHYHREFKHIYLREIHVLNLHVKQEMHKMLYVVEYSPTCPSKATLHMIASNY
jgi:hypothetical protein